MHNGKGVEFGVCHGTTLAEYVDIFIYFYQQQAETSRVTHLTEAFRGQVKNRRK
jgi:hypothetical protein